ncbi:MAG: hypothetical protein AAGC81_04425 [Pseudomonadota bacterium]
MALRARTKLACRIAGIEPKRLNEAIHHGHFKCAPPTRPGAARVFEIDDVVALQLFRVLLGSGFNESKAGEITCEVREHFFGKDIEWVTFLCDLNGLRGATAQYFDAGQTVTGFDNEVMRIAFNVRSYRARIVHALEDEASILGED